MPTAGVASRISSPVLLGQHLTIADVVRVARHGAPVALSPLVKERVDASRRVVEEAASQGRPVYGLTTGVGELRNVFIPASQVRQLQTNIIRSHSAGVGEALDTEVVRALLLARAHCLSLGHSGVRFQLVQRLVDMLNLGLHPVIPCQGSLGASGDLAPLSHMALAVIGEGLVEWKGEVLPAAEALRRCHLEPFSLEAKEGLALINGTQVMTAILALAVADAHRLVQYADIAGALSVEALAGVDDPFQDQVHALRPHPGQRQVAQNLRELLAGSGIVAAARTPDHVQDAYSLRCMPQVHGATRDALAHVHRVVETELNSVTDNPLVYPDGQVISGGNFHGQPLALAADFLAISVAELANIAERRINRLVNPHLSGLPAFLARNPGLCSGYMVAHYTAASLVSENKALAHPASVDSIPTSADQEDHVSMGMIGARKARRILHNTQQVLGIELVCAAQAVEFREPALLGRGTRIAYEVLRRHLPPFEEHDRVVAHDLSIGLQLVTSGELLEAVKREVAIA